MPKYTEDGKIAEPASPGRTHFSVASVRPARRVAPDGSFFTEVVATIMQRRRVPLDPNDPQGPQIWFRGGVTLIIDPRRNHCEIRYAIVKNCGSESRLARQRQSASGSGFGALQALYFANTPSEPFALLHTHNGEFGHAH